MAQWVASL